MVQWLIGEVGELRTCGRRLSSKVIPTQPAVSTPAAESTQQGCDVLGEGGEFKFPLLLGKFEEQLDTSTQKGH